MSVQHTYRHKSGLAVDNVVNTFYFSSPVDNIANESEAIELRGNVLAFYDSVATGQPVSLRSLIGETSMTANRHGIKVYNLKQSKPRVPVYQEDTNNGTANNAVTAYPSEVAVCLSYRAAAVAGAVAARRRGRLYIGPVSANTGALDTGGHMRTTAQIRDTLIFAAKGLKAAATTSGWNWCVRTNGGPVPVGTPTGGGDLSDLFPITHVWCDDAFDTQRRRGPKPTMRASLDI